MANLNYLETIYTLPNTEAAIINPANAVSLGNILYVSANAPVANNTQTRAEALGRIDKPYQSVNAAFTAGLLGDIIYVFPGTYNLASMSLGTLRPNIFIFNNCNITTNTGVFTFATSIPNPGIKDLFLYLQNTTIRFSSTSFFRSANQNQLLIFGDQNSNVNSLDPNTAGTLVGGSTPIARCKNVNINTFRITGAGTQRFCFFENCEIFCNAYPTDNNGLSLKNCTFSQQTNPITTNQGFSLDCVNSIFNSPSDITFNRIVVDNSTLNIGNGSFIRLSSGLAQSNYLINNSIVNCENFLNRGNIQDSRDFLRVINTSICNTGEIILNPSSFTQGRFIFISCRSKQNFTSFELTNACNTIVNQVVSSFISSP